MTQCCTVVIGHVDHGKTALVRALTGIETDRLAEEKARGLSIVPGFAHRTYDNGTIDFIDAPGHADYVQGMIRAATGARAALLVISATEGIQEQTREHLLIAGLLGISRGVVAITKSDLLDPDHAAAQVAKIGAALAQTPFAESPMILCSAQADRGIDPLHHALQALLDDAPPQMPRDSFLPIDRVFSMPGLGTIVTGSLQGARISLDDQLVLMPTGKTISARGLQSRGTIRQSIEPGERAAVNLRGLSVSDISVGDVLCTPGEFAPSRCLDVALTTLPGVRLKHMQDLRLHIGTASEVATLRLFGRGRSAPEAPVLAQLRLKKPVCAFSGQRAVLRRLSPAETLAGVVILDPNSTPTSAGDKDRQDILKAAQDGDLKTIALALSHAGGGVAPLVDVARLSRLKVSEAKDRLTPDFAFLNEQWFAPRIRIDDTAASVLAALTAYHDAHPLRTLAPVSVLNVKGVSSVLCDHIGKDLQRRGVVRLFDGGVTATDHDPLTRLDANHRTRMAEIERAFQTAGLNPISPETVLKTPTDQDLFDLLSSMGRLLVLPNIALKQSLVFHVDALTTAAATLRDSFPEQEHFTTSQARNALSTSRRVIVPMLEYLDTTGITRRTENTRHVVP